MSEEKTTVNIVVNTPPPVEVVDPCLAGRHVWALAMLVSGGTVPVCKRCGKQAAS